MNINEPLISIIIKKIEKLPPEQIEDIKSGKLDFEIKVKPAKQIKKQKSVSQLNEQKINDIKAHIEPIKNEVELQNYLKSLVLNRKDLMKLCKEFDIAVLSSDKVEKMHEKLIDGIMGHQTRSSSIQNFSIEEKKSG